MAYGGVAWREPVSQFVALRVKEILNIETQTFMLEVGLVAVPQQQKH
jgi:hypothetical protein